MINSKNKHLLVPRIFLIEKKSERNPPIAEEATADELLFWPLSAKNSLFLDLLLPFDDDDDEEEDESLSLSLSLDEFLLKFLLCLSLSFELLEADDELELLFLLFIGFVIKLVPAPDKIPLLEPPLIPTSGTAAAVPTTAADKDGLFILKFIPDVEADDPTIGRVDDDGNN